MPELPPKPELDEPYELDEPNPPDDGEPNAEDPDCALVKSFVPPNVLPCGNCDIVGSAANASWWSSSNAIGFSKPVFFGNIVAILIILPLL
jgi:hypothetical protein